MHWLCLLSKLLERGILLKAVDINCYIGNWPFRKLRRNTIEDLQKIHMENNIEYGYISSLNSIFYNDPFEAEEDLHEAVKDTPYKHIMTINPLLPEFEQDIDMGIREFNIKGIKIFPGYHGYSLQDESLERLCNILDDYGLPLFVAIRMEDERLNYIMKPKQPSINEICNFIKNHNNTIIFLSMLYGELMACKDYIREAKNVFFDTSGIRNFLGIEKLLGTFNADKILYGSQFPLYCLKSSFLMTDKAQIGDEEKRKIFYKNAHFLNK